jgi:hypothetical protein
MRYYRGMHIVAGCDDESGLCRNNHIASHEAQFSLHAVVTPPSKTSLCVE